MSQQSLDLERIHRVLNEVELDLSDFSDEYVEGFVSGVEAERDRVARQKDREEAESDRPELGSYDRAVEDVVTDLEPLARLNSPAVVAHALAKVGRHFGVKLQEAPAKASAKPTGRSG